VSHAATTGICNFKISNTFAEFFALSILARWVVRRIAQFNILGVQTKITCISFYLSFSRRSFTKNISSLVKKLKILCAGLFFVTSSPARGQLLYMLPTNFLQDKITASDQVNEQAITAYWLHPQNYYVRQPFNYWVYGHFHCLARRTHIPSPYHLNVHKMVWESIQRTFLNLFSPTRWSWLFLSY
jgi:hypothetical protein